MHEANRSSSSWGNRLASLLYPSKCSLCDILGEEPLCSVCRDSFTARAPLITRAYGPTDLSYWGSIFAYEGRAAQAVQRLKYNRSTALARPLSALLHQTAEAAALLDVDMVVPVPIHWSRRCMRGFNQSELLCETMPKDLLRLDMLRRVRATRPQVGLSTEERLANLRGAFKARSDVAGKTVLLIDDVLTSGQTGRECAAALRSEGAAEVGILAFAGSL
jgi:competence protein ComFC